MRSRAARLEEAGRHGQLYRERFKFKRKRVLPIWAVVKVDGPGETWDGYQEEYRDIRVYDLQTGVTGGRLERERAKNTSRWGRGKGWAAGRVWWLVTASIQQRDTEGRLCESEEKKHRPAHGRSSSSVPASASSVK